MRSPLSHPSQRHALALLLPVVLVLALVLLRPIPQAQAGLAEAWSASGCAPAPCAQPASQVVMAQTVAEVTPDWPAEGGSTCGPLDGLRDAPGACVMDIGEIGEPECAEGDAACEAGETELPGF